jgi:hypothetical protein
MGITRNMVLLYGFKILDNVTWTSNRQEKRQEFDRMIADFIGKLRADDPENHKDYEENEMLQDVLSGEYCLHDNGYCIKSSFAYDQIESPDQCFVTMTSFEQDTAISSKPIAIPSDTTQEEKQTFVTWARSMGFQFDESEIGWYLMCFET